MCLREVQGCSRGFVGFDHGGRLSLVGAVDPYSPAGPGNLGYASNESLRFTGLRVRPHARPRLPSRQRWAVMEGRRRFQCYLRRVELVVVPVEERPRPTAGLLQGAEGGFVRPVVLRRAEVGLRIRMVIRAIRTGVRAVHRPVRQQLDVRFADHHRTAV